MEADQGDPTDAVLLGASREGHPVHPSKRVGRGSVTPILRDFVGQEYHKIVQNEIWRSVSLLNA